MKIKSRLRFLNKNLKKYSKFLLFSLTLVGILLSVFISNINEFRVTKGDQLVYAIISALTTNRVYKVDTLSNNHLLSFTNQWSEANVEILHHNNTSDYQFFSAFETDIPENTVDGSYFFGVDDSSGDIYIVDEVNNLLKRYQISDYSTNTSFAMPAPSQSISKVSVDPITKSVYVAQNSRLLRFSYDNINQTLNPYEEYGTDGFENPTAITSYSDNVYVLYDNALLVFYNGSWSAPVYRDIVALSGNNCAEGIKYLNNKIFISNGCTDVLNELNTDVTSLDFQYTVSGDLRDFTANSNYVYLITNNYLTKFEYGSNINTAVSNTSLSDVGFVSIDLIGNNDIVALSDWFRELYRFNLIIEGEIQDPCPTASPPYYLNTLYSQCDRFVYDSQYTNPSPLNAGSSVIEDNHFSVLLGEQNNDGSIYVDSYDTYNIPSQYDYPLGLWSDPVNFGLYTIVQDSNADYVLAYLDMNTETFAFWQFPSGVYPTIIFPDSNGNVIVPYYDWNTLSSTLIIFPVGDFSNPYSQPLTAYSGYDIESGAMDDDGNLYLVSGDTLYIIENNNLSYSSSSTVNLPSSSFNYDVFLDNLGNGNVDIYLAGSDSSVIASVYKLSDLNIWGSYSDSQTYSTQYGEFAYSFSNVQVDNYNNIFAVPNGADDLVVWFSPGGQYRPLYLDTVSGNIEDILINPAYNDLYITSGSIEFQLYIFDSVPSIGMGSALSCSGPNSVLNKSRCEEYSFSTEESPYNNGYPWNRNIIKSGYFLAQSAQGLFVDSIDANVPDIYQTYSPPTDYSNFGLITDDPSSNGVYISAIDDNTGYPVVFYFNLDDQTFSQPYLTNYSAGNFDMEADSNGNIFLLYNPTFGFANLYRFDKGVYNSPTQINIDFSFNCVDNPRIEIDKNNNIYALCGLDLRILREDNGYTTSSLINLPDYNFPNSWFSGAKDLVVTSYVNNNDVDIYVAGTTSSASTGKVHKFTGVDLDANIDSNQEFLVDTNVYNSSMLFNIYVDRLKNIFVSDQSINNLVGRFTSGGIFSLVSLNSSSSSISDLVVDEYRFDANYNLYITTENIAYERHNYSFFNPTSTGNNACTNGGNFVPNLIFSGQSISANLWVDPDPNYAPPYPSGNIEIRANNLPVADFYLNPEGEAVGNFTLWGGGTYNIVYYYPGDDNFSWCDVSIGDITVTAASGISDSTTALIDTVPSNRRQITGEEFIVNGRVTDPNNNAVFPSGDVQLRREICCSGQFEILSTSTLDSNGNVSFSLNNINPGTYFMYLQYMGDSTYANSRSSNFLIDIMSIQTFLTLQSSDTEIINGDSITLTAQLSYFNFTPTVNSPVEMSGWVLFRANGVVIGDVLMDSNGTAVLNVNTSNNPVAWQNLNSGVHNIRALYRPFHEERNPWLRKSSSETLFQSVTSTSNSGGSNTGSDIPPSGGEGGNSDFTAVISGKDKLTGSVTQTRIGSILEWTMNYNNLGPNSNQATTYFPIRENQEYVIGSVKAPVDWTITFSQDQSCDDNTFNYTPVGLNGNTDALVRCVRFVNQRVSVPPTRSDIRYITTSANFSELNVQALGGTDVWKVHPYNNKLYYLNHHESVDRTLINPRYHLFCFDLEINDTCVSNNPNIVYPVNLGLDGYIDVNDEFFRSQSSFASNAEIVNNKLYTPFTNVNTNDGPGSGNGFFCWDLILDNYCSGGGFVNGYINLSDVALNAWGWGNIGDIQYNPDLQELYTVAVGEDSGYMVLLCYSLALNAVCPGQPFATGTVVGFDPGWGLVEYQPSTGRIYYSGGGNVGSLDRQIQCIIAATKTICPDFPSGGVQILPGKPNQAVFINQHNDQMCAFLYSDGNNQDNGPPAMYCYDLDTETFYNYLPDLANIENANDMYHDFSGPYPDGRIYFMAKWNSYYIYCYDVNTGLQCPGWEGGKQGLPFDDKIYTFNYAFGCMWGSSDSGRVFTFDAETGEPCNPLITLTQGNVAVKKDATDMFCDTNPDDITWNKVKVLDATTTPAPAVLNASVYNSNQCITDQNNIVTCSGLPLKSGNLLLNSGHELDISDVSYQQNPSLTAILEFQYSAVPTPAPGVYIELNPTNKAQMCAETKLVFSGALCANPITTVCENTNISYINDPVSNNNGGQDCLNVETYFGKDPNSALCFVAATPEQRIFTVFNPNASVAPVGTPVNFDPEQTYNRGPESYSFGSGFFGLIQNIIQTTVPQIITQERLNETVSSISSQTPLVVTAVTAVSTATVVVTSVVAAGSGIGQIIGLLLGAITQRKKKYWGIIVDDLTNKPIPFASITLSTKEIGKDNQIKTSVLSQTVSDLDGRYRLNSDKKDKLYLEVKASGYQPFSKFISLNNPLNSTEDIVYDVQLKRIDAKPNFIKNLLNYKKDSVFDFARSILLISSIIGFLFTIYIQINFPDYLNLILLGIYTILFIITFYPYIYNLIQKRGKVIDLDQNMPIPGAFVRIYNQKQQVSLSLTNSKGEMRFDIKEGEYLILSSKMGYKMISNADNKLIRAVVKKEGYLDRNILMQRVEEAPIMSGLENPFS